MDIQILFIYKFYMCTKSDRFTFLGFIGTGGGGGGVYIPDCQRIAIVLFFAIRYHSQFTSTISSEDLIIWIILNPGDLDSYFTPPPPPRMYTGNTISWFTLRCVRRHFIVITIT